MIFRSVWVLLILELFDGCARILPTMVNDHVKEADAPSWISNVDNPSSVVLGAGARCTTTKGSKSDLCPQQVEYWAPASVVF
jgi:hypothetical protein